MMVVVFLLLPGVVVDVQTTVVISWIVIMLSVVEVAAMLGETAVGLAIQQDLRAKAELRTLRDLLEVPPQKAASDLVEMGTIVTVTHLLVVEAVDGMAAEADIEQVVHLAQEEVQAI
jgi:hypothetical protein